jgi:colicin import membrane protein
MIAELADVHAAVDVERQEFAVRLTSVEEKLIVTEARLLEAHGDRDAAIRRAQAALVAQSGAEERSRNAVERADAESARAQRAEDSAESARGDLSQADRQGRELRDQVSELCAKLATMTAQRDAAVHDAEREKDHGDQRVDDLRARHEAENRLLREELAELRLELSTAHEEARVQRSRADRAEARLDNATVASKPRRRQSYAGRGRRRDEATATEADTTGR